MGMHVLDIPAEGLIEVIQSKSPERFRRILMAAATDDALRRHFPRRGKLKPYHRSDRYGWRNELHTDN